MRQHQLGTEPYVALRLFAKQKLRAPTSCSGADTDWLMEQESCRNSSSGLAQAQAHQETAPDDSWDQAAHYECGGKQLAADVLILGHDLQMTLAASEWCYSHASQAGSNPHQH